MSSQSSRSRRFPPDRSAAIQERFGNYWLRDEKGELTKKFRHICWDGCMFPNSMMLAPETWNNVLATMIKVRDAHGWD